MPHDPTLEAKIDEQLRAGLPERAAEELLRGYGRELYAFVRGRARDEADEVFAMLCEDVWRGLPSFRREASFRTWSYRLARHAAARLHRGDGRRGKRLVSDATTAAERVAFELRTQTAVFQRTDVKDRVRALRNELDDDERELLELRIDRGLDWKEIARICRDDDGDVDDATLAKEAAAQRKRFERTKDKLRVLAERAGLLARD